ncbi:MAG TPA: ATP-binding protein [Candidatus Limnocylindrales bacterium]|nr:ATP-binding protein [Candidatus Limnocylindrales bacterium]
MARQLEKKLKQQAQQGNLVQREAEALVSEALFASIGEGAFVTDAHGNIAKINKVALDILGYKSNEVLGKWFSTVFIAEDEKGNVIPNLERPITEAFIKGKPVFRKLTYRKKSGKRVPVALTVSPILLKNKPIGAIQVFRDITEEVRLENSKDEFISIASHQLRTPATIVKQYLGMILEGYSGKLKPAQAELLRIAYENNEHQIETINDLLKVAQADANKVTLVREETNLVLLLDDIIRDQQKKYIRKDLTLCFIHKDSQVLAMVDPLHLRMVFDNLLDNAYKYSHENTKVTVELALTEQAAIIKIRDQGVGIDKKDMDKLFQKFSRIANPLSFVGGTGLGLYWAQKLIDLHSGKLTASSVIGKGTTFTVKVPLGLLPG